MSRIWASGFELGDVLEFEASTGTAHSIQSTTKRSGASALKCLASTSHGYVESSHTDAAGGHIQYFRGYLYIATLPSATTQIAQFRHTTFTDQGSNIRLRADGKLELWDNMGSPAQLGTTSASALSTATWYRIELKGDFDNTSDIELRVDGTNVIGTGVRSPNFTSNRLRVGIGVNGTNLTSGELYWDDVAVNNNQGTAQTSWPGAGSIVHLMPNAAGDSAATSGLFSDIDEVPPNTTDNITIGNTGTTGYYNLQSMSDAGAGSPTSVTLVAIGAYVSATTAANCSWIPRIKSQASGTAVSGTTTTIGSTSWFVHDDTAGSRHYKLTQYTDPQAGGSWTESLVNATQAGIGSGDINPVPKISTVWLLVEYVPSAASPQTISPDAIASTATLHSPTVVLVISPSALASTTTLHSPTVTPGAVTVSPDAIASATTLHSPAVTSVVTVSPDAIAATTSVHAPTVVPGAATLSPDAIAATSTVHAPAVTSVVTVLPDALASTAVLHAPTLTAGAVSIAPDAIAATTTLHSPAITSVVTVAPDALAATTALYNPTLTTGAVTVAPDAIASAAVLHAPTVSLSGAPQEVSPAAIAATTTLHSPTVAPGAVSVAPSAISSTAALHAPAVAVGTATITLDTIAAATQVHSPVVTTGAVVITLDTIASAAAVHSPAVSSVVTVAPSAIGAATSLYAPVVTPGAVTVAPAHVASGTVLFAPSVAGPVVPTVFFTVTPQSSTFTVPSQSSVFAVRAQSSLFTVEAG